MAVLNPKATGGFIVGQDVNVSQTDIVHDLGTRFSDHLGREFMYVRANGAVTGQGYVCAVDASYDATLLTSAIALTYSRFLVVTATNGAPADNDYMWGCLSKPPGDTELGLYVLAACTADQQLYTSATAGALDDTATSQTPIDDVRLLTAQGTAAAGVNTASEWHYMGAGLVGT